MASSSQRVTGKKYNPSDTEQTLPLSWWPMVAVVAFLFGWGLVAFLSFVLG
jgi:hypothetical protein